MAVAGAIKLTPKPSQELIQGQLWTQISCSVLAIFSFTLHDLFMGFNDEAILFILEFWLDKELSIIFQSFKKPIKNL